MKKNYLDEVVFISSKTIKVLLSNRKLTGRKRIAFDNNVHKIAIFSDVLENVKQLNFSLQKFESDNIEFEKKCSDLKSGHLSLGLESTLKKELVIENVRTICWIVPKKYLLLLDQTIVLHFRSSIDRHRET
jgi:GMP synthase PP-ATPase subunit